MAYETITAYRLEDGTITESLAKAEEFERRKEFGAIIQELYQYYDALMIRDGGSKELAPFIWDHRDRIIEALK